MPLSRTRSLLSNINGGHGHGGGHGGGGSTGTAASGASSNSSATTPNDGLDTASNTGRIQEHLVELFGFGRFLGWDKGGLSCKNMGT